MPLEIIPIVVDPHKANEDLKRTDNLMRWYKQIRRALYGEQVDVRRGFFSTKISSLADILPNGSQLSDTFLFNMGAIESKKFQDFINYSTLDTGNQALCSMMFSDYQLNTKMDIGFVGSPNIGSVALNQFKDSEEFKQFSNVFQKTDRVFVVSSIFGGTGAAGYPIIVKNIRNAARNTQINNRGDLRDARIGALTVLPYFNVQQDDNSPISRGDFISKTKSALFYYHDNLTGLRKNGVEVTREVYEPQLSFMGDCLGESLLDHPDVFKSKVLVTECTFLDKDEEQMAFKKGHTHLSSIVKALNELGDGVKCEQIVLTHFSMKYSERHIREMLDKAIPEKFKERIIAFI